MHLKLNEIQQQYPPAPSGQLLPEIRKLLVKSDKTIVVLDDDPTGTQTVYDVPVLTEWSADVIAKEFSLKTPLFYVLTNSRSLPKKEAESLANTIGNNIKEAYRQTGRNFVIISRSDSTLRGHYPDEVDALLHTLEKEQAIRIIVPAFFEGGRFTIGDIHYVQEGDHLVSAAETPFAEDKSFGYQHADLKQWIEEKTAGRVKAKNVYSFGINSLRTQSTEEISTALKNLAPASTCIVNALAPFDLQHFVLALIESEVDVLCRTAASFVAAMGGLAPQPLLTATEISDNQKSGGLTVVGSYVPKSTTQLEYLLSSGLVQAVELSVDDIIATSDKSLLIDMFAEQINTFLGSSQDVVLYTSRKLVSGENQEESLSIGKQVSNALTEIVKKLTVKPRYLIAKGGITSSDIATQALDVKKAMVLGQLMPGIPVWKLGSECKYPDMRYIIFPGNVGNEKALVDMVKKLERRENG
ncbi:uncharacterized protein YgbK (DUF1537 family) [Catalinimonas alkaloidigena]|uniref:four-carbon acid sugar kinase family protein n=1 Tax=Catalinimonas alkaloidigena TaxID=1075417 RepID=UPI002404FFA9|nr:four-carbon acid sugar kinase family protein [Catalinimonas alkaloidigena]MDF9797918.1 uncharacterized protein YgbK (DUF1537 family) [Catalinimonas alkaloidigena]